MLKIFPLGESALTIEFSDRISPKINDQIINLADYIERNSFSGFIETVPAYSSLTIFYDVSRVKKSFRDFATAFDAVKNFAENAVLNLAEKSLKKSRIIEIPVRFDEECALDLQFVAEINQLSPGEVIEIFTRQEYRVYMLGFLPGFAYMGEVDRRIAAPRKSAPRLRVPQGSVGIANRQTGIYPLESPGGWQIIGKTEIELFTPDAENPTFLRAGDTVKFYAEKR